MSDGRRIELMPLGTLQGAKRNPKKHSGDIGVSVERFGYVEAILLDERTGRIVAGHGRREALQLLKKKGATPPEGVEERDGEWFVPVQRGWSSRSDTEADAYLLASNKLTEVGGWDDAALAGMLKELDGLGALDGVGFGEDEIAQLLGDAGIAGGVDGADADEVPEAPAEAEVYVKSGELWLLGEHRLLCGDSTKSSDVARLMGGKKAVLMATDPPYGVAYGDETGDAASKFGTIANDESDGPRLQSFLESVFRTWADHLTHDAAWYLWHAQLTQGFFAAAAAAVQLLIHRQIVWVKPSLVLGHGDYHWRHELCFYGWRQGHRCRWLGDRTQTSVWEIGRENDGIHPTQKPTEVFERPMLFNTTEGEIVAEPFSGSGSQIIAAEKTGRRCYAMELEPRYVQVAIERWQKFTGKQATLA